MAINSFCFGVKKSKEKTQGQAAATGVESRTILAPARSSLGFVDENSNECSVFSKAENGTFKICAIPVPHSLPSLVEKLLTDHFSSKYTKYMHIKSCNIYGDQIALEIAED